MSIIFVCALKRAKAYPRVSKFIRAVKSELFINLRAKKPVCVLWLYYRHARFQAIPTRQGWGKSDPRNQLIRLAKATTDFSKCISLLFRNINVYSVNNHNNKFWRTRKGRQLQDRQDTDCYCTWGNRHVWFSSAVRDLFGWFRRIMQARDLHPKPRVDHFRFDVGYLYTSPSSTLSAHPHTKLSLTLLFSCDVHSSGLQGSNIVVSWILKDEHMKQLWLVKVGLVLWVYLCVYTRKKRFYYCLLCHLQEFYDYKHIFYKTSKIVSLTFS